MRAGGAWTREVHLDHKVEVPSKPVGAPSNTSGIQINEKVTPVPIRCSRQGGSLQDPSGRRLKEVHGTGLSLVGEQIAKASPLQRPIRSDVECVRFTEQSLEFESSKVVPSRDPYE